MTKREIRAAASGDLLRRFEEVAAIHDRLSTAKEANRAFFEAADIWGEFQNRGAKDIETFLELLNSANPATRLLAAGHVLFVAPGRCEGVLEQLATKRGKIGFDAQVTLQEWRAGRLKPLRRPAVSAGRP